MSRDILTYSGRWSPHKPTDPEKSGSPFEDFKMKSSTQTAVLAAVYHTRPQDLAIFVAMARDLEELASMLAEDERSREL